MEHSEKYSRESIWLTGLIEYMAKHLPYRSCILSTLTLAMTPYIISIIFVLLTDNLYNIQFVLIQMLAATTAAIGLFLIWYFDENIFPSFFQKVRNIIEDEEKLSDIVYKYESFFCNKYRFTLIPWSLLLIGSVVINDGFFSSVGVSNYLNLSFLVYILFSLYWAYITGIIIHIGVTTILCVHHIGSELDLDIDPLHPDKLGGLSSIGYFSINATLINSIIGLSLPLGFAIAREGQYRSIVLISVCVYIVLLIILFAYPTIYINKKAQEIRERHLKKRRKQIRELENEMNNTQSSTPDEHNIIRQLKIQSLRDDFHEYQAVNLYPFTVSIVIKLITSIFLPILFTVIEVQVINLFQ